MSHHIHYSDRIGIQSPDIATVSDTVPTVQEIGEFWLDEDAVGAIQGGKMVHTTITSNTTLDETYLVVLCDASGGAFVVTLPAVASNTGRRYYIKNLSANAVTIDGNGSETIDSETTIVLSQYETYNIVSDSSAWWIL